MQAYVVLGLVFSIPSQETGLGKRLRNDLFCVKLKWDVKPQLNQSINQPADAMCSLVRIGCIPTNGTCIEHNKPRI